MYSCLYFFKKLGLDILINTFFKKKSKRKEFSSLTVSLDAKWVPNSPVASLYVRPTMIATEPTLGVGQSNSALLFVLTG